MSDITVSDMVVGRHGVDMVAVPGLVAEVTRRGHAAVIIRPQITSVVTNTVWTVVTTRRRDVTLAVVHILVVYVEMEFLILHAIYTTQKEK